jgi:hypothetical protein
LNALHRHEETINRLLISFFLNIYLQLYLSGLHDTYQKGASETINVDNLAEELLKHSDRHFVQYLLDGIKNGFDTMVSKTNLPTVEILFAKISFLTCLKSMTFALALETGVTKFTVFPFTRSVIKIVTALSLSQNVFS